MPMVGYVQLLPGNGKRIGTALAADACTCGLLFSSSREEAYLINKTLSMPLDPTACFGD